MSPQSPPGYDQDYPWAPPAPEVPHSPTTTTTFSTQSSTASSSLDHWLPIVFATNRPTTPFRQTGLVLFYCAFLALRSEDTGSPIGSFDDHELHGEKSIYAGGNGRKIIDDNYEHALRVFKDRDSGGIRLQASVLRGELKRTPVWTAFITTHIHSSRWMRKAASSSKVIHLADLQRFVFSTEYNPPLGPQGQHELRFISSRDADEFMDSIDDLAA
ncbi:MAG: hypothetical protein LQ344_006991 [Seirophora lacunosa]|nr:MAG: hypothetical protein LQ344_006991 [Seirophora lacunosa]